jgi:acetyltransferase-like isoleucine patch superfamily enzyme
LFYGKGKFTALSGKITIRSDSVYYGMIRMNQDSGGRANHSHITELHVEGDLIFQGRALIGTGNIITCYRGAKIIFGKDFEMTVQSSIYCYRQISFGAHVCITHQCQFADSETHFLRNIETQDVACNIKEIQIASHCWIGNRTSVYKGTVLPEHTTVASNSLLNKAYRLPSGSVIGGMPARLLKTGFERVWNIEDELRLKHLFEEKQNEMEFL